ncbi:MAG: hypothetical protein K0A99_06250 [Desulfoarculaceae bacterium]|nr:hypothetical protein [Desulfoarculaceae bacterium]
MDLRSGETRRHHIHESGLQKSIKKAAEAFSFRLPDPGRPATATVTPVPAVIVAARHHSPSTQG